MESGLLHFVELGMDTLRRRHRSLRNIRLRASDPLVCLCARPPLLARGGNRNNIIAGTGVRVRLYRCSYRLGRAGSLCPASNVAFPRLSFRASALRTRRGNRKNIGARTAGGRARLYRCSFGLGRAGLLCPASNVGPSAPATARGVDFLLVRTVSTNRECRCLGERLEWLCLAPGMRHWSSLMKDTFVPAAGRARHRRESARFPDGGLPRLCLPAEWPPAFSPVAQSPRVAWCHECERDRGSRPQQSRLPNFSAVATDLQAPAERRHCWAASSPVAGQASSRGGDMRDGRA